MAGAKPRPRAQAPVLLFPFARAQSPLPCPCSSHSPAHLAPPRLSPPCLIPFSSFLLFIARTPIAAWLPRPATPELWLAPRLGCRHHSVTGRLTAIRAAHHPLLHPRLSTLLPRSPPAPSHCPALLSLLPPLSLRLFPLASSPCPTALSQSEEVGPRASDVVRELVAMRHLPSWLPHVSHSYPSPSLLSSTSPVHMDQREGEP
jgi:hypothetical protein